MDPNARITMDPQTLHLNKLETSCPTDVSDKSWLPYYCWFFFRRRFLKLFFPLKGLLNFGPQMLGPHEPLDLHLNKLETSCPTDVSDKSWLPCYCWFFRRGFLKLFPIKANVKTFGPQMLGPHGPPDLHLNKFETSCPTDVSDKSWLPCYCWFFRRRFLKLFPIKANVKLWIAQMLGPHGPPDLHLNKLETSCPTDVSDKSWLPCYCWFFRRNFLKLFPIKGYVKLWIPMLGSLGPSFGPPLIHHVLLYVSEKSWLPCYCWFFRRFLKLFPIKA